MKFKYKTVKIMSERDFLIAEKLVKEGWKVISSGCVTILLEKK